MYNNDFFDYPHYSPENTYPFFNAAIEDFYRFNYNNDFNGTEDFDEFIEENYSDNTRSSDIETNVILELIYNNEPGLFSNFKRFRISTEMVNNFFREAIPYALDNETKYRGDIETLTNRIYDDFKKENYPAVFSVLSAGVPEDIVDNTFKGVISFTIGERFIPPSMLDRWSQWEDLGGILSSAPAVSSWAPNRLDTFVRGTDNALWHKWWNGSRWSDWESLGGNLTSAPAAVSWGPNRIDVFARGQGNRLLHLWWNGSRWSNWQNLGGNITSAPAVSSRSSNRLEVFTRNRNNQLITMSWNGSRWSNWRNLDGTITSAPAAVSWGPNRTDVFARGANNAMWHIWRN